MMEELSELLRQKETELAQLHKEIQALRLVGNLLSERREVNLSAVPSNVKPMNQSIDALAAQLLAPASASPGPREMNGTRLPATASYSGTIAQGTNGSTKQFP